MDFSVSYHPISKTQMHTWYFDAFEDIGVCNTLKQRISQRQCKEHTQEEVQAYYKNKYKTVIEHSRALDYDNFNKWHAYFIAISQGFFETFFFVQGSAISGIIDTQFHQTYVSDWTDIVPSAYIENLHYTNKLQGAFSGGAYLSYEQVEKLLHDYKNDPAIKEILEEQFPGKKIEVFVAALQYASQNHQGLLEATKVIEQKPELFEEPECFSNVFNCDVTSAAVYTAELAEHFEKIYKGTGA